jgi:DNA gyrase subunit A
LSAGAPLGAFVDLPADEQPLCLTTIDDSAGVALGTASGVVKRVVPEVAPSKAVWDLIRLEDGDAVVGAARLAEADAEQADLVFITSDAQLLRMTASSVRPQGRAAAGMVGIRLGEGVRALAFTVVRPSDESVVVTVAGTDATLPGTETGTVKVTALDEYPRKGRGTAGVRCHRLRSGEDRLLAAWAGRGPARAAGASGVPVILPEADTRRDGTGTPAMAPIAGIGGHL